MVLSGKPPDYTQCGNSNETNSSVAMETRSKIFDTLFSYGCCSFHLCFAIVVNFTVNLSFYELEQHHIELLYQ